MILLIDNYDSFTYNLVQYLGELGARVEVHRNDAIRVDALRERKPSHIIISPGPGNPSDAGISCDVIHQLGQFIPVLGVCLGHQCIAEVFGGRVEQAVRLMHGKTSLIYHNGEDLFRGVPSPFEAMRYHSLIVARPLPDDLCLTAFTPEGEIMGLRHKELPIFGVQFHPESILTPQGKHILSNFLKIKSKEGSSELLNGSF
jgi:anthranilate synthase/aminodeoxychorismate synthase-like glutamine amidotransferase